MQGFRASWLEFGITKKRYRELCEYCKRYTNREIVEIAANRADKLAAGWIVKSVTQGKSYDVLEYDLELGRIPIGRSNFYGKRRLFFFVLDIMVQAEREKVG